MGKQEGSTSLGEKAMKRLNRKKKATLFGMSWLPWGNAWLKGVGEILRPARLCEIQYSPSHHFSPYMPSEL